MKRGSKIIFCILAAAISIPLGILIIRWANQTPPERFLTMAERDALPPCPDSPNCVCTTASDPRHAIDPIRIVLKKPQPAAEAANEIAASNQAQPLGQQFELADPMGAMLERITQVVRQTGGSVVERKENYLRAEYRSNLFGFVDDVEFLVDEAGETLHFRSASRVGRSDLGVNRKRMERFRRLFTAAAK